MIEMWELVGKDDRRYSTFSWRTRMALRHKQLDVQYRPVHLTDKASIGFSGGTTVPVIRDGEAVVRDSWAIAEHLEPCHPERPSLFGDNVGHGLARLVNSWVDRTVLAAAFPLIAGHALSVQQDADGIYFAGLIERITGQTPAALMAQEGRHRERLEKVVDPARATLKRQAFLSGNKPAYADYVLFSVYQWGRIASPLDLLAEDPVLRNWFEALLDLNGGYARATPAFA